MTKRSRKRQNPLDEIQPEIESEQFIATLATDEQVSIVDMAVEHIEHIPPSSIIPDRFQPRRLLPEDIRRKFYAREIDCYKAASAWLKIAAKDEGWRERVDELLDMGGSFEEHGQIKPITGAWVEQGDGLFLFQIETGERRFWAACLTRVKEGQKDEPLLRVEIVERPSRHRQVIENRHASQPSAVAQACEVASLLLESKNEGPDPKLLNEYDYFRKALELRAPRGFWARTEPVMRLSTRRMQQLLALLRLDNESLELADRYRVPERILREIIALDEGAWEKTLKTAIKEDLTAEDVQEATKGRAPKKTSKDRARRSAEQIAFGGIKRFTRAAINTNDKEELEHMLDEVANEVIVQGMDDELLPLLKELTKLIEARSKRR